MPTNYRLPNYPPMGQSPQGIPMGQSLSKKTKGYAKGLVLDKTGGGY